jgi:hypothetical protein
MIRLGGLIGGGCVKQRIPLFPRLMKIQGGLAIECETEQEQARNRCHGRHGKTHVDPPRLVALIQSCGRHGTGATNVIVFSRGKITRARPFRFT